MKRNQLFTLDNSFDPFLLYADNVAALDASLPDKYDTAQKVARPVLLAGKEEKRDKANYTGRLQPILKSPDIDEEHSGHTENDGATNQLQGSGSVSFGGTGKVFDGTSLAVFS